MGRRAKPATGGDWYYQDALRILERGKGGNPGKKRAAALMALRQLIAHVAGRRPPSESPAMAADESVCDRCFRYTPLGLRQELCEECLRADRIKAGGKAETHKRERRKRKLSDVRPEMEEMVAHHQKRVTAELKRLGDQCNATATDT